MGSSSFLLVAVVMFGAMFLMTRSAKKKQQQASEMRNQMEPGSGIRTIGGMYALVKAVNDDTVELEVAPGVYALYSKQAIAQVLDPIEYNRIVHGDEPEESDEADTTAEAASVEEAPVALAKDLAKDDVKDAEASADADAAADADAEKTPAQVGGDKDASAK
ncbi:preprotein translocase subunit YajC [Streptacidiphilus fuscans]|uniref:preprotein translocase subunit YajC n=1 Tax=Streptacidiphilus fuscans TaxID=2789292 RepID=UPI002E2B8EBB|nr:preprotein translocase subunit YajC [Streptacidiphilus fuscans]